MNTADTFFTPERAMDRFFYLQGLTTDEFYTEGGMNVNLEWLLFCELKRCGYERIIYFSSEWKFYCFDEESFQLMEYGRPEEPKKEEAPRKRGLKKGRWEKQTVKTPVAEEPKEPVGNKRIPGKKPTYDFTGKFSKLPMLSMQSHPLARGRRNKRDFTDKIDAYMKDESIRTAIIIEDANFFLQNAPIVDAEWVHKMSRHMGLPGTNTNILIFIYPKSDMQSLFEFQKELCDKNIVRPQNIIRVGCPNALEIRNMLAALRYSKDIKSIAGKPVRLRVKAAELVDTALEIGRYVKQDPKEPVENRALYHKLVRFAEGENELNPDNCHQVFDRKRIKTGKEQLDELIGMQVVKDAIERLEGQPTDSHSKIQNLRISRILPELPGPENTQLMHIVLTGNPGTGKTTAAELFGQIFYELGYLESGHVVPTDRSGLVAGYVGQTAIKTRERVMEAMGGVLFIDEAYSLHRSEDDSGSNNDFGMEAIDTLVKAMDEFKGKFIVVAAGYPNEMETFLNANPGMKSRFRLHLHIDDYTPEEMYRILVKMLEGKGCRISEELAAKMPDFCENWVNLAAESWGNAREARNLSDDLEKAWETDIEKKTESVDEKTWKLIEERHIPKHMREYLKPVSELRSQVMEKLNELPGLERVKKQIDVIQQGMIIGDIQEPGHYIFAGNPGTGKTTVGRYMGQILRNHGLLKRGHLIEYTAGKLVDEVSRSSRGFEKIVNKALDGVLFIDEAYQLLNTGCGRDIIDKLVPFMENHRDRLCVICAGYEEDMEEFLKANAGLKDRFTETLLFENYSGKVMHAILLHMLKQEGIRWDEEYEEYSLRALTRYVQIHERDKDFSNARYIRSKYIPHSREARNRRLIAAYGNQIPEEQKKLLTGADIPAELVKYTKEKLPKPDTRTAAEKLEALIGFANIKAELRKLLKSAKYRSEDGAGINLVPETLHWVLKGNPGTGKSTIAKMVGQVYKECGLLSKGHTEKVTRPDLVAEYTGQTAPKTRKWIEKAMDGVLFIDEAYSLASDSFGEESITELVEAMTARNGEFAVIAAGYPEDMDEFLEKNDGLRSRVKIFTVEDYNAHELHQILELKCKEGGFELAADLDEKLDMFFEKYKGREAKIRQWANGREVENLLREMQGLWFEKPVSREDEEGYVHRIMGEEHIPEKLKRYLKGKPEKKKEEKSVLEQIQEMIGFAEVKQNLQDNLQLAKTSREQDMPELLDGLNLHWVLEGNPGTGKTTVAKMIGKAYKEMGLLEKGHCVKVTRADLVAEFVGQTAPKTRKCIERAMGGVLFIDEAYMLKREDASGNDYGQEAIDTILEAMSDKNGEFAVIAAGYPKEMEIFLKSNPGFFSRFNEQIFHLEDYTAEELAQIFISICKKQEFEAAEDLEEVLEKLFGKMLSGKSQQWANGREAENLEKQMRKVWAREPMIREEDGLRVKVYSKKHLPPKYTKYLEDGDSKKEVPEEGKKQKEVRIPAAALAKPWDNYQYPDNMEEQEKGIVLITSDSENGERAAKGSGSGFMITSDGFIVTCRHVVQDAVNVSVRLKIPGRSTGDVSWHKAQIVKISEKHDMAILKIDVMGYPYLPVRTKAGDTRKGEGIFLLGYPFGKALSDSLDELEITMFQGNVASVQKKNGADRINVNMEAKRGCSGGAVFSKEDGTIIGILCGSQIHGDSKLREEVNYVLPMKYILQEIIRERSL